MVLTARTLAGVAWRSSARELGELIERLVTDLDSRQSDPDLEPDADCESEPELRAA